MTDPQENPGKTEKQPSGKLQRGQEDYLNDLSDSLITKSHPILYAPLYIILALTVVGLLIAAFTKVDEIAIAEAKVVPESGIQVVSSLEGGILSELNLKEGQIVEEGQVLLKFDPKRFESQYRELEAKRIALRIITTRLRAESQGTELAYPQSLQRLAPGAIRDEISLYQARRSAFKESIELLGKSLKLLEKERIGLERLNKDGMISDAELARITRQEHELQLQLADRINRFRLEASTELSRYEQELKQVSESVVGREDTFERTTIKSPMRATVKNIRYTTLGGAVPAGVPILELVPIGEKLVVEAVLKPIDVAYIRIGSPVVVKLSAYDYTIYGFLTGKVTFISPDTLKDPSGMDQKMGAYYKVTVVTDKAALEVDGRKYPIIPGMMGTAEIQTGKKSILSYLLKPITKVDEAFRER
jgi:membrane fusion protein, adhesin transport system